MAKYLVCGNYIGEGMKGLMNEGGTRRNKEIKKLVTSLGGTVECVYYAFGEFDIYSIIDMPDKASMAAFSLKVSSSAMLRVNCVTLVTPEEIDKAVHKSGYYRAPGIDWLP